MDKLLECTDISAVLDDYYDHELNAEDHQQVKMHIETCDKCRKQAATHLEYLKAMNRLPAPESTDLARLLKGAQDKVEQQKRSKAHKSAFMQGFAAAAICAMVIFTGMQLTSTTIDDVPQVSMAPVFQEVTLLINVPADMKLAELSFELPEGIYIEGTKQLDYISWQTDLKKGANALVLPIMIESGVDLSKKYWVNATLGYKNKEKDFQLPINLKTSQKQSGVFIQASEISSNV